MAETRKVKINEDLLLRCSKNTGIDPNLPFRLQKRKLFENLGFPVDKKIVSIPIKDERKIDETLQKFMERREENKEEFLIITSPKPMQTWIPPLFRIDRETGTVNYRDECGNWEEIELSEVLIKIRNLPPESWVEFARYLWWKDTIAGRLAYVSTEEQILEIQKGVEIPEIDKNPSATLSLSLSLFEPTDRFRYSRKIQESKFEAYEVKSIIDSLGKHYNGFEGLRKVANLPTIEFAYTRQEGLIVVDVDWPAQYRF